ncbi:translation initiation factor IF-2-like isoform X2 [Dermochelys coriacea]|uniref:translation initiation factor IF-2-like isoform X2 n=1 Tax=Dermochelys coriacea TaxID=27794 RepID=UPI001CA8BF6F|nr:translation initiation factor IF-2-like isoform X2 [Dermochelys coriacea]
MGSNFCANLRAGAAAVPPSLPGGCLRAGVPRTTTPLSPFRSGDQPCSASRTSSSGRREPIDLAAAGASPAAAEPIPPTSGLNHRPESARRRRRRPTAGSAPGLPCTLPPPALAALLCAGALGSRPRRGAPEEQAPGAGRPCPAEWLLLAPAYRTFHGAAGSSLRTSGGSSSPLGQALRGQVAIL